MFYKRDQQKYKKDRLHYQNKNKDRIDIRGNFKENQLKLKDYHKIRYKNPKKRILIVLIKIC